MSKRREIKREDALVVCVAISCISFLEYQAITHGIDGTLFALVLCVIGTIVGWYFGKSFKVRMF